MGTLYRQPQGGISIDWSNPITAKLAVVLLPTSPLNLVNRKAHTVDNASRTTAASGIAYVLPNSAATRVQTPLDTSSGDMTVFSLFKPTTIQGGVIFGAFNVSGTDSGNYISLETGQSNKLCAVSMSGANWTLAVGTVPTVNVTYRAAATFKSDGGRSLYLDGKFLVTDSTARTVTGLTHALSNAYAYSNTFQSPLPSQHFIDLLFTRVLTDAEIKSLSDNPWQIFKKQRDVSTLFLPSIGPAQYTLTAQGGSYIKTGASAALLKSKVITAQGGSYAKSGASATLKYNRLISAQGGSYSKSGADSTLLRHKNLSVQGGSYTKTGANANITYTGLANSYTLTCQGGVYVKSGASATLLKSKKLICQGGAYTFAGRSAVLTYSGAPPATGGLQKYLEVRSGELLILKPLG